MGANCNVFAESKTFVFFNCHVIRLTKGLCGMATPLGMPVDPLVKST